jgi:hypothetical protein
VVFAKTPSSSMGPSAPTQLFFSQARQEVKSTRVPSVSVIAMLVVRELPQ